MTEITLFARDGSPVGVTVVDDQDADLAFQYWRKSVGYAARNEIALGKKRAILLHRIVAERLFGDIPAHLEVDHINTNRLDNRRSNLRLATHAQNMRNRAGHSTVGVTPSSKYKGVQWDRRKNRWIVVLKINGLKKWGGLHDSELDAARAHDKLARTYHGEFAYLNFP